MSVKVWPRVIAELHGRTPAEQLMLLMLADFADDYGYSFPAVATLAARCRIKSRYASDILQNLKARGLIEIETNRGPHGANLYRLILELQEAPTHSGAGVKHSSAGVTPMRHSAGVMHCGSDTPAPQCVPPLHPNAGNPPLNHHVKLEEDTNTAARVCLALRRLEISGLNPGHPRFLALIAAGATEAEFVGAAQAAIDKGKGFAYSLGILKNMRSESTSGTSAMPKGSMPIGGQSAINRRIDIITGLTGRSRSHEPKQPIDIIDVPARVVD